MHGNYGSICRMTCCRRLRGHFEFWRWSWHQTPWTEVIHVSTDRFGSVESCVSCCFTSKSAENFFGPRRDSEVLKWSLESWISKLQGQRLVPHVSAVQEGSLFRSLDLCSYISSCGFKFLIRSAVVFLCILINVIKFLSIWAPHSTVLSRCSL